MAIHPPKTISSQAGLGLNTIKELRFVTDTLAIGTETWGDTETPWAEGETVIGKAGYTWVTRWETGKPYVITKFCDETGKTVGIYCDVARPVRRKGNGFEFDDLYLDVWQVPGSAAVILDEDELQEALGAGHVSPREAEDAYATARELLGIINTGTYQFNPLA
jgi:predicted RNA-binding protein associated with RNAse of E/G family